MVLEISKYKNNPELLIKAKVEKLFHLEKQKLDMDKIKTPSDLFKAVNRSERRKDDLGISLFRDIISLDFAKIINANTRIELKDAFRMVRAAIDLKTARRIYEKEAVRYKDLVLFKLNDNATKEISEHFIEQIRNGSSKLKLPKKYNIE